MEHPERDKFVNLPTEEVANIVRARGSTVCVFPFNGTRRWFLLEYGRDFAGDAAKNYVELATRGYINTYELVFEHGIDTIVAPVFGGEILNRGEEYMREIGAGMELLATHPAFQEFYEQLEIRVRFYGDFRDQLSGTPYAHLCDSFDKITEKTAKHKRNRLFYGAWADDATETVAELSIRHFQKTGRTPSRQQLIEQYYGDSIDRADIFIGFEKFNVFDYPMLGWGEESLYFTAVPSLYMSDSQLRNILYDFLYLRPVQDPDYFTMPQKDFEDMRTFYKTNREATFGVGEMRGGIWYSKSGIKEI